MQYYRGFALILREKFVQFYDFKYIIISKIKITVWNKSILTLQFWYVFSFYLEQRSLHLSIKSYQNEMKRMAPFHKNYNLKMTLKNVSETWTLQIYAIILWNLIIKLRSSRIITSSVFCSAAWLWRICSNM